MAFPPAPGTHDLARPDAASPLPLYHQLERILADRIAREVYRDGLPGELELAVEFGVSRGTVRQALDRLARAGIIVRRPGRGSFVAPVPLEFARGRLYRFNREMGERGVRGSSRVLERRSVPAPATVATRLGLDPDARCLRVVRLRLAGGDPLLLETSHVPEALAPPLVDGDLAGGSIYDVLESHGVHVTRLVEEVRAVGLAAGEAAHFGLRRGAYALALDRVVWSGDRPVEHRRGLAPSDR